MAMFMEHRGTEPLDGSSHTAGPGREQPRCALALEGTYSQEHLPGHRLEQETMTDWRTAPSWEGRREWLSVKEAGCCRVSLDTVRWITSVIWQSGAGIGSSLIPSTEGLGDLINVPAQHEALGVQGGSHTQPEPRLSHESDMHTY